MFFSPYLLLVIVIVVGIVSSEIGTVPALELVLNPGGFIIRCIVDSFRFDFFNDRIWWRHRTRVLCPCGYMCAFSLAHAYDHLVHNMVGM